MATKQDIKQVRSVSLALIKLTKKQKMELVEGTNGAPQFVARIGGIVANVFEFSDKKTGEVRTGFKGLFTLRSYEDEAYQATSCFVPKQIERDVLGAIKNGATNVQFQYDIFLVETDKSATGYSWNAEPVLSDDARAKADRLIAELLSGGMPVTPKKLTAPKKD